ncbi:MAG: hypothetical protein ACFB10_19015 [Salibacteraceae bacterium]
MPKLFLGIVAMLAFAFQTNAQEIKFENINTTCDVNVIVQWVCFGCNGAAPVTTITPVAAGAAALITPPSPCPAPQVQAITVQYNNGADINAFIDPCGMQNFNGSVNGINCNPGLSTLTWVQVPSLSPFPSYSVQVN